jgi:hypothetical protein
MHICIPSHVTDRERQTERDRHRETDTERQTQGDRHRETDTE